MHRPAAAAVLLVSCAFALAPRLGAFGNSGHRVVGRLAELHLRNSRALEQAGKILRPNESLADAAVWNDTIKDPFYEDDDTAMFRLKHPAHDVYHYANLPFQADRYDLSIPGARSTDLVQIMRESIRVLRGRSTTFTPREALRLLAHLVGDLHQPNHIGTAYLPASGPLRFIVPTGATGWRITLGGNALVYGPEDRYNLHSYWDVHIVNLAMGQEDPPAYASRLLKEIPVGDGWKNAGDADSWPEQWATEGLKHAKDAHERIEVISYIGPDKEHGIAHRWRIRQPEGYDARSRAAVRIQLAKAGYRLAAVLRAIWPDAQ